MQHSNNCTTATVIDTTRLTSTALWYRGTSPRSHTDDGCSLRLPEETVRPCDAKPRVLPNLTTRQMSPAISSILPLVPIEVLRISSRTVLRSSALAFRVQPRSRSKLAAFTRDAANSKGHCCWVRDGSRAPFQIEDDLAPYGMLWLRTYAYAMRIRL
jgi:hypothetical protein